MDRTHEPFPGALSTLAGAASAAPRRGPAGSPEPASDAGGLDALACRCARAAGSQTFQLGVLAVILANAVVIGLETYPALAESAGGAFAAADRLFVAIFVVEIGVRLLAYGRRPLRFFTSGWNVFDFTIVAAAFVPGLGANVTLLRIVRVLRVVRLVNVLDDLRVIVRGLMRSLAPLAGVGVFVVLILYVYAIIGTALFGEALPEEWGTAGAAMLTCFRILTLDNWDDLFFPALEVTGWATPYFLSFIVVATLVILNIVIAVVVSSVEQAREAELRADAEHVASTVGEETPELADRIAEMRSALDELEQGLLGASGRSGDSTGERDR